MSLLFQSVPSACLELCHFSTYRSQQLQHVSALEFASPAPDFCLRYVVSNTPLPTDRRSFWAVEVKANSCSIHAGVISDTVVQHNRDEHNVDQSSYCGICVSSYRRSWTNQNGKELCNDEMKSVLGDVLLFRFDPLQCQLTIMNSHTQKATDITEVACNKPLYITLCLRADSSELTRVELRQVTADERAMLIMK